MEPKNPTSTSATKKTAGQDTVNVIKNITSQKQVIPYTTEKKSHMLTLNAFESIEMEGSRVESKFKRYVEKGILTVTKK